MKKTTDDSNLVLHTAKQLASGLLRAIVDAHGLSDAEKEQKRFHGAKIHFHDDSQYPIAWNDIQAILSWNEAMGDQLPVPMVASEGYNQHGHTSPYDGGWIPGMGPHDHRDNFNGGFAFACFHPGTSLPQQPWAIYSS
jgi:hypothetical protein